jgi:hypothetical protein
MPTDPLPLPIARPHNNQQLFSDHLLKVVLPVRPHWTLLAQLKSSFKHDIPVNERDQWEEWLTSRKAEHREWTDAIVRLETLLNERVDPLFGLTAAEIAIVEESTKYRYGEVW